MVRQCNHMVKLDRRSLVFGGFDFYGIFCITKYWGKNEIRK